MSRCNTWAIRLRSIISPLFLFLHDLYWPSLACKGVGITTLSTLPKRCASPRLLPKRVPKHYLHLLTSFVQIMIRSNHDSGEIYFGVLLISSLAMTNSRGAAEGWKFRPFKVRGSVLIFSTSLYKRSCNKYHIVNMFCDHNCEGDCLAPCMSSYCLIRSLEAAVHDWGCAMLGSRMVAGALHICLYGCIKENESAYACPDPSMFFQIVCSK